ncbi:hypothetical protein SAMN06265222_10586 [Neorhodopirellula lusitana]|uniref:N-acetyltransferase domain-containing protein n=1 Tax=Neorhodopirellula lusitana TaxID=445327 RepID=A0ABY1Q4D8_9BACT|nr:GNAT family N-acetyltransferase [Neorhodopirellula lusitana]SMP56096.1 hypothetical protein SAMN06265222_10586 [Neorhodopirellula lusitana]
MGMTYFRRYRMELKLDSFDASWDQERLETAGYSLVSFDEGLIREHAQAKFQSFRCEMDADVFPCLGRRDGCLLLMREISARATFVPGATWLVRYQERPGGRTMPVATVQGIEQDGWGAIQNLGVIPEHRGRGLGRLLMQRAATGFQAAGLSKMNLEVTTANTSAVRLYEQLGFSRAKVVYKACEIAGA